MRKYPFTRYVAALLLFFVFIAAIQPVSQTQPKPKPKTKTITTVKKKPDVSGKVARKKPGNAPQPAGAIAVSKNEPVFLVEISTKYGPMLARLYNETPLHRDNFIKLVKDSFYDDLLFHRVIPNFMIQGGDPTSKNATPDAMIGAGGPGYTIPAEIFPHLYHRPGVLAAARDNNPTKASSGSQFYIVQGRQFTSDELTKIQNSTNMRNKSELLNTITKSDSVKAKLDDFMLRGDKEGMNNYFKGLQPTIDAIYEKQELKYSTEQLHTYINQGGAPFLDMNYTVFGEVISGFEVIDSIAAQKTGPNDRPTEDIKMKIRMITK